MQAGFIESVKLLLDYGADPKLVAANGETLLFQAVYNSDNSEVLQLLIDLGLNVNHKSDKDKNTPLFRIAILNKDESHFELAKILLKSGADICYM